MRTSTQRGARTMVVGAMALALAVPVVVGVPVGAADAGQAAPEVVQAQQVTPQGRGQGRGGRGGGRGAMQGGEPIPFDNYVGFEQIFNGTSLDGWEGDPTFWRVENGTIVGESTPEKEVEQNTFLIWRGGTLGDFDLKVEFRLNAGNSGVQYRSEQLPESDSIGKWVLKGYQADIDFDNNYTGMLYEERGRGFLAPRGHFNYIGPNQPPQVGRGEPPPQPAPGEPPFGVRGRRGELNANDALRAQIKQNDWNQFQVIARGNVLIHVLNGHVTALLVDDDEANRAMEGLLGLQIHTGPPMKVEFRNVYLRQF